jgi:nucleotide-binding universal stress UspA family protein
MSPFKHILVPTDFGEASERAVDVALGLASKLGEATTKVTVTLLHAAWMPPAYYAMYAEGLAWPTNELEGQAKKELDKAVEKAKERCADPNVQIVGSFAVGEPVERILEATNGGRGSIDLIVMGTHGRRGVSRVFLGSVAEKVVRLSPVPVMTVCTEAERRVKAQALAGG